MVMPYVVFNGNCKEAMEFYRVVFESDEPRVLPYGDYVPAGLEAPPKALAEWVMHAEMQICGTKFWFADETAPIAKSGMVKLSASVPTAQEARKIFAALSEGAVITQPPTETFYSAFHAALEDKFGVHWNVVAEEAPR